MHSPGTNVAVEGERRIIPNGYKVFTKNNVTKVGKNGQVNQLPPYQKLVEFIRSLKGHVIAAEETSRQRDLDEEGTRQGSRNIDGKIMTFSDVVRSIDEDEVTDVEGYAQELWENAEYVHTETPVVSVCDYTFSLP